MSEIHKRRLALQELNEWKSAKGFSKERKAVSNEGVLFRNLKCRLSDDFEWIMSRALVKMNESLKGAIVLSGRRQKKRALIELNDKAQQQLQKAFDEEHQKGSNDLHTLRIQEILKHFKSFLTLEY